MVATTETTPNDSQEFDTVDVSVDELIVGRSIQFPVHDRKGLLLLAANSVITPEIQRNLKSRGLERISMRASDANAVTLNQFVRDECVAAVTFDTELTRQLDEIIDGGNLSVVNVGRAVKERMVSLGRRAYDRRQRERLVESHEQNGATLRTLMGQALHGRETDGGHLTKMATGYVSELATDTDCTLTSAIGLPPTVVDSSALEVSLLSMAVGIETGMDADNVRDLGICALVNDWGMNRIPDNLRQATRRLTESELIEIRKHPIHTLNLLEGITKLPRVAPVVIYQIHESPNGHGYPRGRRGTHIHPFASIIHVTKAYVALTKRRPYRPALMRYSAMEWLVRQAHDGIVDTKMVRALLKTQSLFPIGSFVTLSNGSVAQILRRNGDDYARPIVQLIQNAKGQPVDPAADYSRVNLAESKLSVEQALPTPGSDEIAFSPDHLK